MHNRQLLQNSRLLSFSVEAHKLATLTVLCLVAFVIVCTSRSRNRGHNYVLCSRTHVTVFKCRPANSHDFVVSLTIFCLFSRSYDKTPKLTVEVCKVAE